MKKILLLLTLTVTLAAGAQRLGTNGKPQPLIVDTTHKVKDTVYSVYYDNAGNLHVVDGTGEHVMYTTAPNTIDSAGTYKCAKNKMAARNTLQRITYINEAMKNLNALGNRVAETWDKALKIKDTLNKDRAFDIVYQLTIINEQLKRLREKEIILLYIIQDDSADCRDKFWLDLIYQIPEIK